MPITSNQTPLVVPGAYSGTFGTSVPAGDTVFLCVSGENNSGATMSSSAPLYGGSSVTGAAKLIDLQCPLYAGGAIYCAIWMLPGVAGGSAAVAITLAGSSGAGTTYCGLTAYDIAGLGTSPVPDKVSSASGSAVTVTSGTTATLAQATEIAIGVLAAFGGVMSPAGGLWADEEQYASKFALAGLQFTSSTAGVVYTSTQNTTNAQAGIVATVAPGGGAAAAPGPVVMTSQPPWPLVRSAVY